MTFHTLDGFPTGNKYLITIAVWLAILVKIAGRFVIILRIFHKLRKQLGDSGLGRNESVTMDDTESWPPSYPELKEIEDILKCGICHGPINTPVLTSCSHAYCSLCIRRWLLHKQVCPTCSDDLYESSLRKIPMLDSVIVVLGRLKQRLSGSTACKSSSGNSSSSNTSSTNVSSSIASSSIASSSKASSSTASSNTSFRNATSSNTSSSVVSCSKLSASQPKSLVSQVHNEVITLEKSEDEDSEDFAPKASVKTPKVKKSPKSPASILSPKTPISVKKSQAVKVPCPVCFKDVLESIINAHVDRCLDSGGLRSSSNNDNNMDASSSVRTPGNKATSRNAAPHTQTLEPIKKMVYNLMSDALLRKELKKHGLSTQGDRRTITSRLQRYVTLHNAECDATNPRTQAEIRQQFEREEKANNISAPSSLVSQIFKPKQDPTDVERVQQEYREKNKANFKSLIEAIKQRDKPTSKEEVKPKPVIHSDSEEENSQHPPDVKIQSPLSDSETKTNVQETPIKKKRPLKRKVQYIESDSDGIDDDLDVKEVHSPVLSLKANTRKLRSRSHKKEPDQSQPPIPTRSRTNKKVKNDAVQNGKKRKGKESQHVPDTAPINDDREEINGTPDMFVDSSPASSDIPCGQRPSKQESDYESDGAIEELITLMEDSGSSTDFER